MAEQKSGYLEGEIKETLPKAVSVSEQEVTISWMRDEPFAKEYASDSTEITLMDRLCRESPEMYELIEDTRRGKIYLIKDKNMISHRKKKREMSPEQKKAASERFKQLRADGKL